MSSPLDLPELLTFHTRASWLNAAGNLDRSACVELRISELRKAKGLAKFAKVYDEELDACVWKRVSEPLPFERAAANGRGRICSGIVSIREVDLLSSLHHRPPRTLGGDWRTQRAPGVRREDWERRAKTARQRYDKGWKGFSLRLYRGKWFEGGPAEFAPVSPNRGRNRTKVLALPEGWRQSVRVEKWRLKNRKTAMFYFVCPCGAELDHARNRESDEPGLARLSTRPTGFMRKGCPQRVLFLMLVQATKAEWRDAQAAWDWIQSLPAAPPARLLGEWSGVQGKIDALERRYGRIFPPRRMLCRQCLGAKYGNHPETARLIAERLRKRRRAEAVAKRVEAEGPGTLGWVRRVRETVKEDDGRRRRTG